MRGAVGLIIYLECISACDHILNNFLIEGRRLTVNVKLAHCRYLDCNYAVLAVYCPCHATQACHADAGVDDREIRQPGEQKESGNSIIVDERVGSDAEIH